MNRKERRAAGERGPQQFPLVELAFIHPGDVSAAFMQSVIRCRDYELLRTKNLMQLRERRSRSGSIAKARNQVTTMFLRSKNEWLWFVDADMGFGADALQRLLHSADPVERPVVGGLCFAHRTEGFDEETNAEYFGHLPTIYLWKRAEDGSILGFETVDEYPRNAVFQCDTTGAACVLIHRSVLERMRDEVGEQWWSQIKHPERPEIFGEDTSFFMRLDDLGVPLHIDTSVRTSHDKGGIFLTEQTYAQQELLRALLMQMDEEISRDGNGELGSAPVEAASVAAG